MPSKAVRCLSHVNSRRQDESGRFVARQRSRRRSNYRSKAAMPIGSYMMDGALQAFVRWGCRVRQWRTQSWGTWKRPRPTSSSCPRASRMTPKYSVSWCAENPNLDPVAHQVDKLLQVPHPSNATKCSPLSDQCRHDIVIALPCLPVFLLLCHRADWSTPCYHVAAALPLPAAKPESLIVVWFGVIECRQKHRHFREK